MQIQPRELIAQVLTFLSPSDDTMPALEDQDTEVLLMNLYLKVGLTNH